MSKRQLIIILASLIIIIDLFLGLPNSWNTFLHIIISLLIIAIAYATTKTAPVVSDKKTASIPFIDSTKIESVKSEPASVETKQVL